MTDIKDRSITWMTGACLLVTFAMVGMVATADLLLTQVYAEPPWNILEQRITELEQRITELEALHEEPEPTPKPEPNEYDVTIIAGSSVPGCEATDSCYLPYNISVLNGDTVRWYNGDSAAHTVTSPRGEFDSSLIMAGTSWSHTFNANIGYNGEHPYFCMVHPWMEGVVTYHYS